MIEPERLSDDSSGSQEAIRYDFVVHLKDHDDSAGLARLLEDVLLPTAEGLAHFIAPAMSTADLMGWQPEQHERARERLIILLVEEDDDTSSLIHRHAGSVLLGIPKGLPLDRHREAENVTAFRVNGPIDFAAEVMERFSGPSAAVQLFDPHEAMRMRRLAAEFPLPFETEDTEHEDPFLRGQTRWKAGELTEALADFDAVLAREPDHSQAHLLRGYVLRELAVRQHHDAQSGNWSQTLNEARKAFRRALESGSVVPTEVGDALYWLEDYSSAAQAYRAALTLENSAGLYTRLGSALALDERLESRFELASDEYTKALRIAPGSWEALTSRAVVRLHLCEYENALADSLEAERHGCDTASMFFHRAFIHSALGDLQQARTCADRARTIGIVNDDDREHWFQYVYAHTVADLGDLDEAGTALETTEGLARRRGDDDLLAKISGSRGLVFARLGQLDRARVMCELSLARGNVVEPCATLAWICQYNGHADEARIMIERTINLIENSASWQHVCTYQGAKWPFYLMHAAILNTVAEQYDDLSAAGSALTAAGKAQADWEKAGRKRSDRAADERPAQIFLERARAHALCGDHHLLAADLHQCLKYAPRNSRAWYAATRALRYSPIRSLEIDARLIILTEVVLLMGAVALLLTTNLSAGAFATLVIGLLTLGLVAFALPVVTELRIGALQVQKAIGVATTIPLPQFEVPLTGAWFPQPPQVRADMPSIVRRMRRSHSGAQLLPPSA